MDDVTAATRAGVDPILVDRNNEYPQYNGVKVENLMDIVFKKEDIKLLIVDIDWTILDHDTKDYDHASIEALKKAQEKGIKICIATARPYESINAIELFKFITPDCLITCNGAAIFYNDELVHTQEIPPQVVRRICKEAVKHHLNVELNGPKTRYVVSKRMEKVIDLYKVFYDKLPQYQKYDGKPV